MSDRQTLPPGETRWPETTGGPPEQRLIGTEDVLRLYEHPWPTRDGGPVQAGMAMIWNGSQAEFVRRPEPVSLPALPDSASYEQVLEWATLTAALACYMNPHAWHLMPERLRTAAAEYVARWEGK